MICTPPDQTETVTRFGFACKPGFSKEIGRVTPLGICESRT